MNTEANKQSLNAARAEISATTAFKRLAALFDDGAFSEIDAFARSSDSFSEVVAGRGLVNGVGVYAYAQNKDFAGGAMSAAQAAKIRKVYDLALKTGAPVVAVYDSIGGRLDEGTDLLGAYGDVLRYSGNLSGVVPQISVVLGQCCGTQALIAVSADIVIMSEDAKLGLNTDGSNSDAKTAAGNGVAHFVEKDEAAAITRARQLLELLPSNNLDYAGNTEYSAPKGGSTADDILDGDSAELLGGYGKGVRTILGSVEGTTVGLVEASDKKLDGKACSKAARFVRFCDAFGLPVVTLVDAQSFSCIKAAAKLSSAYAEATSAKITVITGEAYGAVYIAMAGTGAAADITFAWPDACISALAPEAAAVIALGDDLGGKLKGAADPKAEREKVVAAFRAEELNALKAAAGGYIQDIIEPSATRAKIVDAIEMLMDKRVSTLPKKHNNLFI